MITAIKTVADVEAFARQLVSEGLTGGFHPDDPFSDYISATGEPLYSTEEAAHRDVLMEQCFDVCGDDVYEVIGRITLKDTPAESIFDETHERQYSEFMEQVETGERDYKPNGIGNRAVSEITQARYN